MPRKPRYYLAGVPCHVIQRGHNREPCFSAPDDFRYYLQCLREACLKHEVGVHAYVEKRGRGKKGKKGSE